MFQEALDDANQKSGCSEKRLYKNLRKRFRNHVQGEFNRWLAHTKELPKRPTNYSYSIYKEFKWYDSLALSVKSVYKDTAADVIQLGDVQIGTDKIEHFFGRGYVYYLKHYKQGKSIKDVLKFGHTSERYMLGGVTTGVYSYGDLAANFTGMRFWNHILQKGDDVFGQNLGPYVVCQQGKWRMNKGERKYLIDWSKYVTPAWDEANNCAMVRSEKLKNKMNEHLALLSKQDGRPYTCPMQPELMAQLQEAWGPLLSSYLLNLDGFSTF
jgi:hypothetical protein